MMGINNTVQDKLIELIGERRDELLSNNRKLKGLLLDHCPRLRKEITAILLAFDARIPDELLKSKHEVSDEMLITRLTQKLIDAAPMSTEAARWAVVSWAFALKIIGPQTEVKAQTADPQERNVRIEGDRMWLMLAPGVEMEFVRVPAGEFLMGSDRSKDKDTQGNELPQHKVYLDEYLIGKYPVTNLQYQSFVKSINYSMPRHWEKGNIPEGKENHPVVNVSWLDTKAFCIWASQKTGVAMCLPTEAQWEKAARGIDGRIFPWGDDPPDHTHCNYHWQVGDTTPVGQYSPRGNSPYSCADMAGNIQEWVADWYDEKYYTSAPYHNPPGPITGDSRVFRGGSLLYSAWHVRVADRYGFHPGNYAYDLGFRCAALLPGESELLPHENHSLKPQKTEEMIISLAPGVEMEFVRVPKGVFLMGSNSSDVYADDNELPQHQVFLDEYWIGKYPVTNIQYGIFVQTTGYSIPYHWNNGVIPQGKENHPVVHISWGYAVAFCRWISEKINKMVRLPSEAQWEKAARGTEGWIYPWGDNPPDRTRCNFNYDIGSTTPVGQYSPQGDSPYGCADIAGNVWEWVADRYNQNYYRPLKAHNPLGPTSGTFRVQRGGSWNYDAKFMRAAYRLWSNPDNRDVSSGFRCVLLPEDQLTELLVS